MQGLIYKFCTENETWRYIDHLQDLVQTYMKSSHRTIGMPPAEGELEDNALEIRDRFEKRYLKLKPKEALLRKGDLVRVTKTADKFYRGYYQTTNPEIFMIHSINQKHRLPSYEIRALPPNSELISGFWRPHELVFVSKTTKFSVSKVLRTDKSKKNSLVKYNGLPDNFLEWVPTAEVERADGEAVFAPLLKYANITYVASNEF